MYGWSFRKSVLKNPSLTFATWRTTILLKSSNYVARNPIQQFVPKGMTELQNNLVDFTLQKLIFDKLHAVAYMVVI